MSEPVPVPPPDTGYLVRVFGIDLRSLAALRIGIGLVLLLNLAFLLPDVPAFYTDDGILPREAARCLTPGERYTFSPSWVSLHQWSGGVGWQYALFAVMAGAAVAVLVGYRTPAAVFVSWLLLVGLQARNPLILHGGDRLLRCLLFWCLFLPMGARWSLDARARPPAHGPAFSLASLALLIQLGILYFFTADAKSHPVWTRDFTALHYALNTDLYTTPLGYEALRFPDLLRVLTAGALGLEYLGPLLLLVPARGWWFRTGLVAAFWGLHLGIAATMTVGLFPLTCMVYWLAVLPRGFWDRMVRTGQRPNPQGDPALPARVSLAGNVLLTAALVYVLALQVARSNHGSHAQLKPGPFRVLGEAAHLDQHWHLFAPRPHNFGGWFEVIGVLPDGTTVNLLDPPRSVGTRPDAPAGTLPSTQWRKAFMGMYERGEAPNLRRGLADYYRRQWDAAHPPAEHLRTVTLIGVMQPTPPPGSARDPAATRHLVLARWASDE